MRHELAGLSLGGYLAALLAGLEPQRSFAISIGPPVRLWDLPARLQSSGRLARHRPGAKLIWLDGSHPAPFGRYRILDVAVAHLRAVGLPT